MDSQLTISSLKAKAAEREAQAKACEASGGHQWSEKSGPITGYLVCVRCGERKAIHSETPKELRHFGT